MSESSSDYTRRDFVKKSSIAGAAIGASAIATPNVLAQDAAGKRKLKVGVVGLGGRGSGAVGNILKADPDTILWAVGDIFEDRMKKVDKFAKQYAGRVDTDNKKREFVGFDAYQKVIDSGVDVVLLTSTPMFRPLHFAAAVAAGKHCFIEKPFALDVPGLLSVIDSAKKAKASGISVLTGLVWRYSPHLMEFKKRLEDGAIGDILTVSSAYCGGRPNKMPDPKFKPPGMTDMEWTLRYWQNFLETGGDGILEYMIHGIDRMTWFMGDLMPVKGYANGGNIDPVKGANAWDQFSLRFEYADGRLADFFGRQIRGCYAASGDTVVGTKGRGLAMGRNAKIIVGDKVIWEQSGGLGYENEHKILTQHIRAGKVYNDVLDKMANSHAAAIMGRCAGYTGKLLTEKDFWGSKDELIPNMKDLNFDTPFKARESAFPGRTKFV